MDDFEHLNKIRSMFDRITPRYDLLNRLMSGGQDMRWRKRAVSLLGDLRGGTALDLCCGTGDFIRLLHRQYSNDINIIGADLSEEMLRAAGKRLSIENNNRIVLCRADALMMPFPDSSVDAVTIGFGIRNIEDRPGALREVHRLLKPGGRLAIIEPAFPRNFLLRWLFKIYFRFIMPIVGGIISGDYKAYRYLNESAEAFPDPARFVAMMTEAGFSEARSIPQAFGTAMIYYGRKDSGQS